ncbi:endonuclease G, mitochondrial-like [Daphnia carinata]|uniref:endonuclease G, mitochondrial-like n=1 Tax=Daphnia carinata TaxID=120202 RepID=UPI00257E6C0E|nr:endonuclease G, mitochondrial-like [Daphnia carinata]
MFRKKFITVTSVAFGSFLAGFATDKFYFSSIKNTKFLEGTITNHDDVLLSKPGLPIFGTVSAASIVPANTKLDERRSIPPEPIPGASRVSQIMRFGFPGLDNVRSLDDYILSYDRRNRTAHWVFEHLTAETVAYNEKVDRSKCDFVEDESVHPYFRSSNSDYKASGFDRGHLAAAGNHRKDQLHCQQTFLLSNMSPQVGKGFNRDSWNRLERHVRNLTKSNKNVYVCTGPLYLPRKEADGKMYVKYQVIGKNHVAVPTHFFKVIVMENHKQELSLESYVMPNQPIDDKTPLTLFQVAPETVERAAGLLFFDKLSLDKLKTINGKSEVWL